MDMHLQKQLLRRLHKTKVYRATAWHTAFWSRSVVEFQVCGTFGYLGTPRQPPILCLSPPQALQPWWVLQQGLCCFKLIAFQATLHSLMFADDLCPRSVHSLSRHVAVAQQPVSELSHAHIIRNSDMFLRVAKYMSYIPTSLWFLRFHSIFKTSTSLYTLSDTIHQLLYLQRQKLRLFGTPLNVKDLSKP